MSKPQTASGREARKVEKIRTTFEYLTDFRSTRYQITKSGLLDILEITPDYAFGFCRSLLSDPEAFRRVFVENQDGHERELVVQVASVAYNFCAQTSQLIWKAKLDEDILLDLLLEQILKLDSLLQRVADHEPGLQGRIDTIPFRLLVALSKKRAELAAQPSSDDGASSKDKGCR